jgi:methylthioribose-1-phosphate isomerase
VSIKIVLSLFGDCRHCIIQATTLHKYYSKTCYVFNYTILTHCIATNLITFKFGRTCAHMNISNFPLFPDETITSPYQSSLSI